MADALDADQSWIDTNRGVGDWVLTLSASVNSPVVTVEDWARIKRLGTTLRADIYSPSLTNMTPRRAGAQAYRQRGSID